MEKATLVNGLGALRLQRMQKLIQDDRALRHDCNRLSIAGLPSLERLLSTRLSSTSHGETLEHTKREFFPEKHQDDGHRRSRFFSEFQSVRAQVLSRQKIARWYVRRACSKSCDRLRLTNRRKLFHKGNLRRLRSNSHGTHLGAMDE